MQSEFTVQGEQVTVQCVLADSAYTRVANLDSAEEMQADLIGPLAETKCDDNPALRDDPTEPVAEERIDDLPVSPHTKKFDKAAFVYNEATDCYHCPAGKQLPHRITYSIGEPTERKVYTCADCAGCSLADQCVRKSDNKGREVIDDAHEVAHRRQRRKMATQEAQEAYSRRQHFGEVPFAVIKVMFDLRTFLLRGIEGVGQEWRWASTAFNLKKLMGIWETVRAEFDEKRRNSGCLGRIGRYPTSSRSPERAGSIVSPSSTAERSKTVQTLPKIKTHPSHKQTLNQQPPCAKTAD